MPEPRRWSALACACAVVLAVAAPAARAATPRSTVRPKLAVLDLQASGASASLAGAAGGALATELDRLGVFEVVTSEAIRALLALEKQKAMLGCADGACLAEIGGALGVDYLVSGRVSALGAGKGPITYGIDLVLTDVRRASREGSAVEAAVSEAELVQLLPRAVSRLTAKVLSARSGRLVLVVSEAGALVKVDAQARGTTPLPGPLEVPSGPRTVTVEKQGFVAWQADVTVQPGRLAEQQILLVPSADFIDAYESRARKMRVGAWTATGAALAGLGAAVAFQLEANRLYGDAASPGTFLYYRQKVLDGAAPPAGVDYRAEAQRVKTRITTAQNLSYAGMGLAAVGGGVATWLWVAGDDPGRYARYRGRSATLQLHPLPGGAGLALAGAF